MHYGCYEMCTFKITADFSFFLNFLIFFNFPLTFKLKKKITQIIYNSHNTLPWIYFNGTTVLGNANCTDP